MLAFVVVLQMMGYPIPVPDAVLAAALRPSEPFIALGAESSEQIWNALLSVEGGLPDDILLGIPSVVIAAKDGEAAVRHIGRVVMTSSDQSIAVLSAWYNDPTPVTKPSAVSDALNEWIRVGEQLTAEGASPTPVQRRISLAALFGRIPDISRAFDALQAVVDVMDVDDMIKQVRRIGDRNTSLASQKRAIAMMSAAASDSSGDVSGEEARRGRKARAMAAAGKRQKTGRCKFWDSGHCKFGDRCRFHHVGEAGNGHPPPPGHQAPPPYVPPPTLATEDGSEIEGDAEATAVAHLAEVFSRMLRGVSNACGVSVCDVAGLLTSRLQMLREERKSECTNVVRAGLNVAECSLLECENKLGTGKADVVNVSDDVGDCGASAMVAVVCDTAATMPVVGADLIDALASKHKSSVSVLLDTAHGTVNVDKAVDVPGARGLMDKSLVVDSVVLARCVLWLLFVRRKALVLR